VSNHVGRGTVLVHPLIIRKGVESQREVGEIAVRVCAKVDDDNAARRNT
jgi:hypothetical protein